MHVAVWRSRRTGALLLSACKSSSRMEVSAAHTWEILFSGRTFVPRKRSCAISSERTRLCCHALIVDSVVYLSENALVKFSSLWAVFMHSSDNMQIESWLLLKSTTHCSSPRACNFHVSACSYTSHVVVKVHLKLKWTLAHIAIPTFTCWALASSELLVNFYGLNISITWQIRSAIALNIWRSAVRVRNNMEIWLQYAAVQFVGPIESNMPYHICIMDIQDIHWGIKGIAFLLFPPAS